MRNMDFAKRYFKKGCRGDDLNSCLLLGNIYLEMDNRQKSALEALKYFDYACSRKEGLACMQIGNMYLKGEGVQRNMKKSLRYFHKSCNTGFALGCEAEDGLKSNIKRRSVVSSEIFRCN